MSTKKYKVNYDGAPVALVEIDEDKARTSIKEMVEFWACWESQLRMCGGNYTECWLANLGMFILNQGRAPKDDEGWVPLDGSAGIRLVSCDTFEFDRDLIEIKEDK